MYICIAVYSVYVLGRHFYLSQSPECAVDDIIMDLDGLTIVTARPGPRPSWITMYCPEECVPVEKYDKVVDAHNELAVKFNDLVHAHNDAQVATVRAEEECNAAQKEATKMRQGRDTTIRQREECEMAQKSAERTVRELEAEIGRLKQRRWWRVWQRPSRVSYATLSDDRCVDVSPPPAYNPK